jgi:hypothetical protein
MGTPTLELNEWAYLVIVMTEDRDFRVFKDGNELTINVVGGAKKVRHTKAHCKIGENFIGDIDEIGMWKRALTPEEAKVLYAGK